MFEKKTPDYLFRDVWNRLGIVEGDVPAWVISNIQEAEDYITATNTEIDRLTERVRELEADLEIRNLAIEEWKRKVLDLEGIIVRLANQVVLAEGCVFKEADEILAKYDKSEAPNE